MIHTYVPESQGVQAWDRYAYANNSPVNLTDPTGHFACGDGIDDSRCEQYDPSYESPNEITSPAKFGSYPNFPLGTIHFNPPLGDPLASSAESSYSDYSSSGAKYNTPTGFKTDAPKIGLEHPATKVDAVGLLADSVRPGVFLNSGMDLNVSMYYHLSNEGLVVDGIGIKNKYPYGNVVVSNIYMQTYGPNGEIIPYKTGNIYRSTNDNITRVFPPRMQSTYVLPVKSPAVPYGGNAIMNVAAAIYMSNISELWPGSMQAGFRYGGN